MMTTTPHLTAQPVTRPFSTPVRGHAFAARVPGAPDPTPGQFARLVREPANPADRYAVSVWIAGATGKWRIGYLDRSVAARIAPRLDRGARIAAKIDGWTPEPDGRWRRPVVMLLPNVEQPPRAVRDQDQATRSTGDLDRRSRERKPAGPGLWGRPPGVSRRRVRDEASPPRR